MNKYEREKFMSEQQVEFVMAYVRNGGNAAQAATEAGWHPRYGRQALVMPAVKAAIERHRREIMAAAVITDADVMRSAARALHADLRLILRNDGSILPVAEWPDDIAQAVDGVEFHPDGQVKRVKLTPERWREISSPGISGGTRRTTHNDPTWP